MGVRVHVKQDAVQFVRIAVREPVLVHVQVVPHAQELVYQRVQAVV